MTKHLLNLLALLALTAFFVAMALGAAALTNQVPVTSPGVAVEKAASNWLTTLLFGYGWLCAMAYALAAGPRNVLGDLWSRIQTPY